MGETRSVPDGKVGACKIPAKDSHCYSYARHSARSLSSASVNMLSSFSLT
jgi:hypothetical protein